MEGNAQQNLKSIVESIKLDSTENYESVERQYYEQALADYADYLYYSSDN